MDTTSGLGRGKDMNNIIEADRKRKVSEEEDAGEDEEQVNGRVGQPPTKKVKAKKKHKRLTDLDIDGATESETTEYEANGSEQSEEPEPSEDEYLPAEFKRSTRGYFLFEQIVFN